MSSIDILADKVFEETDPFLHYTEDFEKAASTLREIKYRSAKPEDIAMPMLAAVAQFYDGDWAGILDADLVMKVWSPLWWYNRRTKGMTPNSFDDIQEGD